MKKTRKRLFAAMLVAVMFITTCIPAYAAQDNGQNISGTQDMMNEGTSAGESGETDNKGGTEDKSAAESKEDSQNPGDSEGEPESQTSAEQEADTQELQCNYILVQDDGEHQSVILEMGEEGTTALESAVLSYRDGNGEIQQAQAEEVQENLAAFLLNMPNDGAEREFISVETSVQGVFYTTSMAEKDEMENVEITEEEAAAVVEETQQDSSLDSETAQQVQNCVISAEEGGITAEDIETAIEETNKLAAQGAAARAVTFDLQDNGNLPSQPKEKTHYIVVLDPGHGGYDGGAENQYGSESESKLTLKIAKYLKEELSKYSQLTVYMTREDDTYVGLNQRVEFAVNKKADILVSLHLNSFDYSTANGAEVLVPKTGRYNSAVAENAERLAKNILKRITALGLFDRGLKYRDSENGSKYPDGSTADYFTTIAGGMKNSIPSIIVEHAFISGAKDAQYLDSEQDLKNFAKADAYGIAQYFDIETGGENYEEVPEPKGQWKKVGNKYYYYIGTQKQTGWVKVDNDWYYLDGSGVMQTGWQKIGGSWYYLNSSGRMLKGWQKVSGKWYYLNDSGSMRTGWQEIDGKKYYLNGSGAMQTGWQKLAGKWYYFNGSGAMQTGWITVSNKRYYINSDGIMQSGWQKLDGKWYYLNSSGAMQTGWQKVSGKWYYMDSNGVMLTGWQKVSGKWYYMNGSGAMQTGWQLVGGKWYYMNGSGVMQNSGWTKHGGKWYYLNSSGAAQTNWGKIGGKWYYFGTNAIMRTGWQLVDGKWYYLNGSGVMQNGGWTKLGGKWYYLNGSGAAQTGWGKISGKWYYFGTNAIMRTGWQKASGKWYYLNGSGVMQTGWTKLSGKWYFLNAGGDMAENWKYINNYWYYFKPGSGVMQTGWYQINGKQYYSDNSGHMMSGWQKISNQWYYFNSSGVMQTGWITIGDKEYYFDNTGIWDSDAKRVEDNSSTQTLYKIMGESAVEVEQMANFYEKSGVVYPSEELQKGGAADIETFCTILKEEADAEGVCAEVVFAQAMKETGWLKYGGDVKIEQFNFAGLGATGNGNAGNTFKDVRTGLRAQVQHLKAYASEEALVSECVDERFKYVDRGSALYVEWLGIQENPDGKGWAASKNYGYDLVKMIQDLKEI